MWLSPSFLDNIADIKSFLQLFSDMLIPVSLHQAQSTLILNFWSWLVVGFEESMGLAFSKSCSSESCSCFVYPSGVLIPNTIANMILYKTEEKIMHAVDYNMSSRVPVWQS